MHGVRSFIMIIPAVLFFSVSCKSDKHKGELQFYYYPGKNVYYDPVKKVFLYSLNGGKNWNSLADVENAEPATMGGKVVVFSKKADVYRDNESHRRLYGGRVYNIISDTATVAMGPEAMERKVAPKRRPGGVKRPGSRKNENGIGKFINRIFGKHRKET